MADDAPLVDPTKEAIERGESQPWIAALEDADKHFAAWQTTADGIDKVYANLEHMRRSRDREFQLFWSNIQVIGPSIYARPPVPVVTPKFKDRRPLYRTSSEFLERTCVVAFDATDIDQTMIALRDDLTIVGRGASRVIYESDDDGERVCIEHMDRRDFMHEPARKWCDVGWVAFRSWLTKDEMRERFGDAANEVSYTTRRNDDTSVSHVEKCGVWEIWSKTHDKVVWVTEGSPKVLEDSKPHLKLRGFFPCPRPAYATLQRRSLIPVPDMIYYQDQLNEVNDLTRRIHALSWAIKVRGFYAGGGDLGDAIERAIKMTDDEQLLIPVPALTALMQGSGDPIMWMPLEMIANTITGLIELRRQIIDDVYQIMGLSDIMRGSTDAQETLGAQQIKQQNGSVRVRDKQNELIRVARDLVNIVAEIMAEEFDEDTLVEMAQMDLPTDAEIKKQIKQVEASARKEMEALADQAEEALTQQDPQKPVDPKEAEAQFNQQQQQIIAKYSGELAKLSEAVTIDAVMAFLRDQKLRPFVLDIETDSTVYPDEMREKQSRVEFMQAFSASMGALMPMMAMGPEAMAVAGGVFKFALSPYRVGRELEGLIDDFVDQAPQIAERMAAAQGDGGDKEVMAQLAQAELQKAQAQTMKVQADGQFKMQEMQLKAAEAQAKAQADQQRFSLEVEDTKGEIAKTAAGIQKIYAEIQAMGVKGQAEAAWVALEQHSQQREDVKLAHDMATQATDTALTVENSAKQHALGERKQGFTEASADRSMTLAERQAERDGRDGS